MKNKFILPILLLPILLLSCNNQNSKQVDVKDALIEKIIKDPEINTFKTKGKIFIVKTKFCKDFDCETYFSDYKEQIQIYPMEEAFMIGLVNYLEIEELNEEKGEVRIKKREGKKFEEIKIEL